MKRKKPIIMGGRAHPALTRAIAEHLGVKIGDVQIEDFLDGEINLKVMRNVRGRDVFVIQPTCPDVHKHLFELCSLVDCLYGASAARITAVIPYFGYARSDRKGGGREPINAALVARLLEASHVSRILTIDLHASQIGGFFDIPVDHLYARTVLMDQVRALKVKKPIIVSPDVGGSKLASAYAKVLGTDFAIVSKRRDSGDRTTIEHVVGDVSGRDAILVDDIIATGGTITDAARIVRERGARRVFVVATHAVFAGSAVEKLNSCPAERIIVTDTIPQQHSGVERLTIVSVAPLLADAIRRIHTDKSVSRIFQRK